MSATIEFACLECGTLHVDAELDPERAVACDGCGTAQQPSGHAPDVVDVCPACGGDELYVQRDFNRKLGVAIVVVAALFAWPTKGLSLLAAVLIDLALHRVLPTITICYRCSAIVRGLQPNPAHAGFDMTIEDKYRAIRAAESAEPGAASVVTTGGVGAGDAAAQPSITSDERRT